MALINYTIHCSFNVKFAYKQNISKNFIYVYVFIFWHHEYSDQTKIYDEKNLSKELEKITLLLILTI